MPNWFNKFMEDSDYYSDNKNVKREKYNKDLERSKKARKYLEDNASEGSVIDKIKKRKKLLDDL